MQIGRTATSCPFRYQGQYEDAETGLYYNRFRYYSPDEGIYISQDPIGLAGGNPTLYGYVSDVNAWVDVLGLDCRDTSLSDDDLLVSGGTNTADQFTNGSGVTTGVDGKLDGVSVNSKGGLSAKELSDGIPNGKVGVTTVGDVRKLGGNVVPSPTKKNANHSTLSGITAKQTESLFNPIIPNPHKKMKEFELKEIELRCNRATKGPWLSFIEGRDHTSGSSFIRTMEEDIELIGATEADQDFIANARQDIPILIKEIRRLKIAALKK